MTLYDIAMILIVLIGIAQGAWRGMIGQIAPIASLILGYAVALPLSVIAAPFFGQGPTGRLVALLVIYLAVSLGVYLLVRSVRETLEKHKLQEFDRHLGTVLGGIKGLLFSMAITFFAVTLSPAARDYIFPTYSGFAAAVVMDRLHPVMPHEVHDILEPYIHSLDDTLAERGYEPIADDHHVHDEPSPNHPEPVSPPPSLPFRPQPGEAQASIGSMDDLGQAIDGFLKSSLLEAASRLATAEDESP